MPDVWTTDPETLRTGLESLGAGCNKPARIIKDRDTQWTCYADSKGWIRDIYIHPVEDFLLSGYHTWLLVLILGVSLLLGYLLGRGQRKGDSG